MPLNSTGPISIGGSTAGQSINLELGQSATAQSSLNDSGLRNLAGVASGAISLSNFYGKSGAPAVTIANPLSLQSNTYQLTTINGTMFVRILLYGNGTMLVEANENGVTTNLTSSAFWASPTTANVGNYYWYRATRTGGTIPGGSGYSSSYSPTTNSGWVQITGGGAEVARVTMTNNTTTSRSAQWTGTIEIATDSAGTNIVSTSTFVSIRANVSLQ